MAHKELPVDGEQLWFIRELPEESADGWGTKLRRISEQGVLWYGDVSNLVLSEWEEVSYPVG